MSEGSKEAIGHREVVKDYPLPLSSYGLRTLEIFGLPAVVLSWTSAAAAVGLFALLQATGPGRALFRLPVPALAFAAAAAVVGAIVLLACRRRPGRRFPRYWIVGLTAVAALVAVYSVWDPVPGGAPWCHAAALATLAGTVALAPRLIRLRPESRWVDGAAPLGLLSVVLVFLPIVSFARWSYLREIERFGSVLAFAHSWADGLPSSSRGEAGDPGLAPADLERVLGEPSAVSFEGRTDLVHLWRAAAVLEREDDLRHALGSLAGGIADALDPAVAPRVSSLGEPSVRWDSEAGTWITSSEFGRWSGQVGAYYHRLGTLFSDLDPQAVEGSSPALNLYRERYRAERRLLRHHLEVTRGSWADHWAVARVPAVAGLVEPVSPPLTHLLQTPLSPGDAEGLCPADLWRLLDLGRREARSLASDVPGCHRRLYREGEIDYERVDCHAHAPATEDLGAELRVELRLVFSSAGGVAAAAPVSRPVEVFFLFPVPEGGAPVDHLEEVAAAMVEAVKARWNGGFRLLDRSGSALHGFVLEQAGGRLVVYRPLIVPFADGRQAVVVRGERRAA